MKQYYAQIRQLALFSHMKEDKDMDWLFRCIDGSVREYRAGETIFSVGEETYFAAVVVDGMVQGLSKEGGAVLFDPGDLLIDDYREGKSVVSPLDYVAKTDCKLLFTRWIRMMKVCNFECAFHRQLLEKLSRHRE